MSNRYISKGQKTRVAKRAKYCCEYCLSQLNFSTDSFSVEHIVPLSTGGSGELDNLALACQGCNNHKYVSTTAVDSISGQLVPLFNPRQDSWSDHFAWSHDFTQLIGLSPVGRATVAKLKLNRVGVVNLRTVLVALGKHPPYT